MATVSGNIGGTAGNGARAHLRPRHTDQAGPNSSAGYIAYADSSGDFSWTGIPNGEYLLTASLAGFVIRQQYDVAVIGNNNVTALTFTISAINSANTPPLNR